MRSTRIGLVLLSVWLLAAPAGLASAQEGEGLSDVLTDLLRGSEGAGPTAGPDRRVPFGREEMQLSFAPLVKETAPAVVNVYASSKGFLAARCGQGCRTRWAPASSSMRAASSSPTSTSYATPTR
jgi:S1-C subfamily serine protease